MSDQQAQQEPTMEEILASIRRIISDDEKGAEDAEEKREAASLSKAMPSPTPVAAPRLVDKEEDMGSKAGSEEMAAEEGDADPDTDTDTDAGIDAAMEADSGTDVDTDNDTDIDTGAEDDVLADAAEDEDDDILELTEMVSEDGSVVSLKDESDSAEEDSVPMNAGASELLSDQAANATVSAFASLAGAVADTRGTPIGGGGRTLEEMVKELLRPMLKEWLDENLPVLVERLVQKEIARLSRQAEDAAPDDKK